MTPAQVQRLLTDYDLQPISVDSLGGSKELATITTAFNYHFSTTLSEAAILGELIKLRKGGRLAPKGLRKVGAPRVLELDSRLFDADKKCYNIPVVLHLDWETVISVIDQMIVKPVTRAEVLTYVLGNAHTIYGAATTPDPDDEDCPSVKLAALLFPELRP